MHAVQPVHVYVENHVKHPMVGTNVDETIKSLNKEKQQKKKVKLATTTTKTSTQINRTTKKSTPSRPRSLSPNSSINSNTNEATTNTRCNFPSGRRNLKLKTNNKNKDEIPEKDFHNRMAPCEVCTEAKSRSRSRSPSVKNLNNSSQDLNNSNYSLSSATSFNQLLAKQKSHSRSLENINNDTFTIDNKQYFKNTLPLHPTRDNSNALILKSSLKNINDRVIVNKSDFQPSHELLLQKLIETEGVGNDIARQLSSLKDFLKLMTTEEQINSMAIKRLENDRDLLLKNLETYEGVNNELRNALYDIKALEKSDYRRNQSNDSLIKHIDVLEQDKSEMKKLMLELEKTVTKLSIENDQLKLDNAALLNLKVSMENNRAHLRKQLSLKEQELSRLSVKLRTTERKLETTTIQQQKGNSTFIKPAKSNMELSSRDFERLVDAQSKRLIEKLQTEIKQKDGIIKQFIEASKRSDFDFHDSNKIKELELDTNRSKSSLGTGRNAEDKLKVNREEVLLSKEEQLREAEEEITRLRIELEQTKLLVLKYEERRNEIEEENANILKIAEAKDNEVKRIEHFREIELDKVRSTLQERLNELERLPELLKNAELKLQDALKKQKDYELRNVEQTKLISELNSKVQELESQKDKDKHSHMNYQSHRLHAHHHNDNSNTSLMTSRTYDPSHDTIEKRIKLLEEENHDLFRQLTLKDEALRDVSNRLATKTNEASSLSRQLELALNDSKLKEDHIKDKYNSKERTVQARCIELETQLSKLKIDYNSTKREKEEIEYRYQSQIKDLKDRLDQSYSTNKSMQNYVNFLKNSYATVFNDNSLINNATTAALIQSVSNPSLNQDIGSSQYIIKTANENTNFF